jgi:ABC-type antimicrobial peptide transport system permease subunit
VRTLQDLYEQRSVKIADVVLTVIGAMGLIGLGLALVGLYAVVAYQVSRQTREIGIRMAIGASKGQILKMILRQAAVLGVTGLAIGLALSLVADGQLASGLHISFDPMLLTIVVAGLLLVTLGAAFIPARRAALIDPMLAMRQD